MTLTERDRHDAYEALAETFGPRTDIVIAMLQPATNLVTRDDLTVGLAEVRSEMAVLRTEMAELRSELKTEIHSEIGKQTRMLLFTLLTAILVSGALNSLAIVLQS